MILQAAATAAPAAATEPDFTMYVVAAVFLVVVTWLAMRWTRKTVQKDLDPSMSGKMRASMAIQADLVAPALVKEALAKGLVTSSQLATMSPVERQYLFQTLRPKLDGTIPAGGAAPSLISASAPNLPLKPTPNAAPANAPQLRSTQAISVIPGKPMSLPPLTPEQIAALGQPPGQAATRVATPPRDINQIPFGMDPNTDAESLKVHCPFCGGMLLLPAFPPHVTFCDLCGAKTAVRTEDQGRLVINSAPPGVTRRPIR